MGDCPDCRRPRVVEGFCASGRRKHRLDVAHRARFPTSWKLEDPADRSIRPFKPALNVFGLLCRRDSDSMISVDDGVAIVDEPAGRVALAQMEPAPLDRIGLRAEAARGRWGRGIVTERGSCQPAPSSIGVSCVSAGTVVAKFSRKRSGASAHSRGRTCAKSSPMAGRTAGVARLPALAVDDAGARRGRRAAADQQPRRIQGFEHARVQPPTKPTSHAPGRQAARRKSPGDALHPSYPVVIEAPPDAAVGEWRGSISLTSEDGVNNPLES